MRDTLKHTREGISKMTGSRWRLKRFHAEPPPQSQHPDIKLFFKGSWGFEGGSLSQKVSTLPNLVSRGLLQMEIW